METLENIIKRHESSNNSGALKKMQDELGSVVHRLEESVRNQVSKNLDVPKSQRANLIQGQTNLLLIEAAIRRTEGRD